MKDIMRFWLGKGCDGFRVDMADSLVKNDDDKKATSAIWRDVRAMLDSDYPEAVLVSEWSDPGRALKAGFHADFYLDHEDNGYHALFRRKDPATGAPLGFFGKRGTRGYQSVRGRLPEALRGLEGRWVHQFRHRQSRHAEDAPLSGSRPN